MPSVPFFLKRNVAIRFPGSALAFNSVIKMPEYNPLFAALVNADFECSDINIECDF